MKILMSPKIVFTVIAILNLLHGLMLLFGAESMYMEMAPGLSEESMTLGATELEICSAFNFFLAIVLFSCRSLKFPDVKNVLIGTGIGLLCLVGLAFKQWLDLSEIITFQKKCFNNKLAVIPFSGHV